MARNRKSQATAVRLGAVLKAGILCSVIITCCVGYVWQKKQIDVLGQQITKREARLRKLQEQNDRMKTARDDLRNPRNLELRIAEMKLGLVVPKESQIWRLPEPAATPSVPGAGQQLAADRNVPRLPAPNENFYRRP